MDYRKFIDIEKIDLLNYQEYYRYRKIKFGPIISWKTELPFTRKCANNCPFMLFDHEKMSCRSDPSLHFRTKFLHFQLPSSVVK